MKYLVELVLGVGLLALGGMALFFSLRFLLLVWIVQVARHVVQNILRMFKTVLHALIFVIGTAVVGAFVIGLGLQIGANLIAGGADKSADPTMPVLVAFLAFFVIVAVRGWQWSARCNRLPDGPEVSDAAETSEPADYPTGYEAVADAWNRAITLAPKHRDELLDARAVCAELVNAVEGHHGIPDIAMIETAALIRNNLAALVCSTERRLRGAKRSDKAAATKEMVTFLQGFALRAQQNLVSSGPSVKDQDAALRAHLTSRLFG